MKTVLLDHDYDEAARKQRGKFPAPSHVWRTFEHDIKVIGPKSGEIVAVMVCEVLPRKLTKRAFRLRKDTKDYPSNRVSAMGTRSLARSIGLDGTLSPRSGVNKRVLDATKARQGMLGWDASGHKTSLTIGNPEMLSKNKKLLRLAAKLYEEHLPEIYARQKAVIAKFPQYSLFRTAFSTLYIANFRTAYHRDKGNLPGVMTCLIPLGNFTGGELVFPRFRIAFALQAGDILLFDPHELHGNLPFSGKRISIALYCSGWVAKHREHRDR